MAPGLLEGFIRLADGSDEAVLRYARRWGPLWLCEHGVPWQYDGKECIPPATDSSPWCEESLDKWREYAREARAVLRIARKLDSGQPGSEDDWDETWTGGLFLYATPTSDRLTQWVGGVEFDEFDAALEEAHVEATEGASTRRRTTSSDPDELTEALMYESPSDYPLPLQERVLARNLNEWLAWGGVTPNLFWQDRKRSIRLAGNGLFGALAIQLLFDCCRTDGLAVCTACGTPYLPPKRPRRDRNAYCSDCGRAAAVRDAAARYRRSEKYQAARLRRLAKQQFPPASKQVESD
jgi:hypothetical protein